MRTITSGDDFASVLHEIPLVVAKFEADWCGPCKAIKPTIAQLETAHRDVLFVRVDIDEFDDLSASHSIATVPTFLFFVRGQLVDTLKGANAQQLRHKVAGLPAALAKSAAPAPAPVQQLQHAFFDAVFPSADADWNLGAQYDHTLLTYVVAGHNQPPHADTRNVDALVVSSPGRTGSLRVGDIIISVNGTPLLNNATLRSTTGSGRDFKYAALKLIAETAPPRTLRLLRPAGGAALTLSPADAALVFDEAFAVKPVAMPGGLVEGPTVPDAAAAAAVGSHVGQLFAVEYPAHQAHGLVLIERDATCLRAPSSSSSSSSSSSFGDAVGRAFTVRGCVVAESFLSADVRPGDIVLVVNGQPVVIPRPATAAAAAATTADQPFPLGAMVTSLLDRVGERRDVLFLRPTGDSGGGCPHAPMATGPLTLYLSEAQEGVIFGSTTATPSAAAPLASPPPPQATTQTTQTTQLWAAAAPPATAAHPMPAPVVVSYPRQVPAPAIASMATVSAPYAPARPLPPADGAPSWPSPVFTTTLPTSTSRRQALPRAPVAVADRMSMAFGGGGGTGAGGYSGYGHRATMDGGGLPPPVAHMQVAAQPRDTTYRGQWI